MNRYIVQTNYYYQYKAASVATVAAQTAINFIPRV
jgi:hypothetical protein